MTGRRFPREPLPKKPRRIGFLLVSQQDTLRMWGREVRRMFGAMPYHVGSSLKRPDFRDVDVRLLLDDAAFDELAERIHLGLLNHTVSLWGQQVTGLPIDFQVQRQTDANEDYPTRAGHWRNPIGIDARTHDTRERHTPGDR
jgi:hypothetical protein